MALLIRVRSPVGTQRFTIPDSSLPLSKLLEIISEGFSKANTSLYSDPAMRNLIANSDSYDLLNPISCLNLKNGDMLYAKFSEADSITLSADPIPSTSTHSNKSSPSNPRKAVQDPIFYELEKTSGSIERKFDPQFCKHNSNSMCEYCMPLEPYDPEYLKSHKIKHMSYESYLRKSISNDQREYGLSSGPIPNSVLPLEEPDFSANKNCTGGHLPWPHGVCTKCQPGAITLQQQEFRMTDHLEFSEGQIVDRYLSWWRETGTQRFGLMYGRYEKYTEVPLGIKAVVEAIYEPVQDNMPDGLIVHLDSAAFQDEISKINLVAKTCKMELLGMIITDLTDDGTGTGKVEYKRHKDTYFLTNLETRLASRFQNQFYNASIWSESGRFGSKFVTAIVSGNEDNDIDISAWQISNTGVALETSNLIVASSEPSLMMVRQPKTNLDPSKSEPNIPSNVLPYVPEILYKYKDEYGASILKTAKPFFPVEYLLVSLTHGFPSVPNPLFKTKHPFNIENRQSSQSMEVLYKHFKNFGILGENVDVTENIAAGLSDFHLTCYLSNLGILENKTKESDQSDSDLDLLGQISSAESYSVSSALITKLFKSPDWMTLIAVISNHSQDSNALRTDIGSTSARNEEIFISDSEDQSDGMDLEDSGWDCTHCTFRNPSSVEWCEICGLPRYD
ncbi:Nuclear protein localization protein 4 [Smittium mucronatum]|uniref:Nuclear protein localization protein 4 n=1 Tax=Smittium mucronatum TaxID=133383 RepID=A0A1R0H923_9FUNG|nr:Nuclear protein localization protein 4 [Smittium mucronatum]